MDLIRRQEAINLLQKWSGGYTYIETETESAIEEFKALPSVDQDSNDMSGTQKALDTISRKAAIEAFQKELCREREYAIGFSGIERILNALPSIEPEIIRCKECKFYDHFWNGDWCSLKNMDVKDTNDFCSRAKGKTDEWSNQQTVGD